MNLSLDQSPGFFLTIWDLMTPLHKKIASVLVYFEKARQAKIYQDVFPSREKIAKLAGCSVGSVKKFLKKFAGLILTREVRKFKSSLYSIDQVFFELVKKMQDLGWIKNWEKHRKWVMTDIIDNDQLINEKWAKKFELSTRKVAATDPPKVAAIKDSYIKTPEIKKYGTNERSAAHLRYFKELGIGKRTERFLEFHCSESMLLGVKNDYLLYSKTHTIDYPSAFVYELAKKQVPYQTKQINNYFKQERI